MTGSSAPAGDRSTAGAANDTTTVEQFLAMIMSEFPEELGICYAAKRRAWEGLDPIDGIPVPSARMLAVFLVAGRRGSRDAPSNWRTALRESTPGGPLSGALKTQAELLSRTLRGGEEFAAGWLDALATGFGATDDQRLLFHDFAGLPGTSDTPRTSRIASLIERDSVRGRSIALDYAAATSAPLVSLPTDYPEHLTVGRLADALSVAELPPGWTSRWENISRLYSDDGSDELHGFARMKALEALDRAGTTVLLADPGHGKSTVLAAMALAGVKGRRFTLFVRLTDLASAAHGRVGFATAEDVLDAVLLAVGNRTGRYATPEEYDAVVSALTQRPDGVLLLDGLDEVPTPADLSTVRRALRVLDQAGIRTVVSSRLTGYSIPVAGAAEFLLGRLRPFEVDAFVHDWFDDDALREFEPRARLVVNTESIVRIPLIIGFVCLIAEVEDVRTTKHGLYEQYLELFFQRRWKDEEHWVDTGGVISRVDAATEVAWAMAAPGIIAGEADLKGRTPPVWSDNVTPHALQQVPDMPRGFESLLGPDGLLVPHDAAGVNRLRHSYRWIHRTVHEHLAGRAFALRFRRDPRAWAAVLRHFALRPRTWRVALEHAAGFLQDLGALDPALNYLIGSSTAGHDNPAPQRDPLVLAATDMMLASGTEYRRTELARELLRGGETSLALRLDRDATFNYWSTADLTTIRPQHLSPSVDALQRVSNDDHELAVLLRVAEGSGLASHVANALARTDRAAAERIALEWIEERPLGAYAVSTVLETLSDEAVQRLIAGIVGDLGSASRVQSISALSYADPARVRRALGAALQPHGPVGALLLALYERDINHDWSGPVVLSRDHAIALLTTDVHSWAAHLFAWQGVRPDELDEAAFSPWARAGLAVRRFEREEPPADLTAASADEAIARFFGGDLNNPDPASLEHLWDAVTWSLAHGHGNRAEEILRLYNANSIADWQWWASGAEHLQSRIGTLPWADLLRAARNLASEGDPAGLWFLSNGLGSTGLWVKRAGEAIDLALEALPHVGAFPFSANGASPTDVITIAAGFVDNTGYRVSPMHNAVLWTIVDWLRDAEVLDDHWAAFRSLNLRTTRSIESLRSWGTRQSDEVELDVEELPTHQRRGDVLKARAFHLLEGGEVQHARRMLIRANLEHRMASADPRQKALAAAVDRMTGDLMVRQTYGRLGDEYNILKMGLWAEGDEADIARAIEIGETVPEHHALARAIIRVRIAERTGREGIARLATEALEIVEKGARLEDKLRHILMDIAGGSETAKVGEQWPEQLLALDWTGILTPVQEPGELVYGRWPRSQG